MLIRKPFDPDGRSFDRAFAPGEVAAGFATPVLASTSAPAALITTVLTFEALTTTDELVPAGYGGLEWDGFGYIKGTDADTILGQETGFSRGVVSGQFVAYISPVTSTTSAGTFASDHGNFNFNSASLTAALREGQTVDVRGYDDGVEKYHQTVIVSDDGPTRFAFAFKDIDEVTFTSTGGTPSDSENYLVFDNVSISSRAGAISGIVYNDKDNDGVRDTGEAGLQNRTVFVDLNHNGVLDTGEYSAVTNASGRYTISGVPFGDYDVVEVPKAGSAITPLSRIDDYTAASSAYHFVDIAQAGNQMVLSDKDDGFAFFEPVGGLRFYGQTYSGVAISANGFIALDDTAKGITNTELPNGAVPNGIIAALWNDYNLANSGAIYAVDDSAHHRFIVEWKDVPLYGQTSGTFNTFEAIVNYNGTVEFEYQRVNQLDTVTATVGVENQDGTVGTQVSFGAAPDNRTGYTLTPLNHYVLNGHASVTVDSGVTTAGVDFGNKVLPPNTLPATAFETAPSHGEADAFAFSTSPALHDAHVMLA